MMRLTFQAAILVVMAAGLVPAQDTALEIVLSHVVNDEEVSTTRLFVSPSEIRGKGASRQKSGSAGTDLIALLQRDAAGHFVRYDRQLASTSDGTLLSGVSVVAEENTLSFRERGPMGSRTKSVMGPAIDFVVDAAFPEVFIPYLLDESRKSVRVLLLPELEIKTVVIEDRDDRGRFAGVPGGGITLFTDESGGFAKLALPGPEARVIVPSGTESRPAPEQSHESRVVLDRGGGIRLAFTLALPAAHDSPYPAALLLGDAGVRDRNGVGGGALVPAQRLLAEELARSGIATIRADKRGAGDSVGPDPDLAALVLDARSLLDVLALHPAIDRDRVFLVGHGEGAVVAADLARSSSAGLAGIVTLAGPARPFAEALEAKLRVRLSASGQLTDAIESAVVALRLEIESLRALPDAGPFAPGQALLRDLVRIDPAVQIASLRLPLLIVHAGQDKETPASQVALMRASLLFSSDRARFELVDSADHDLLEVPKSAPMTAGAAASADVARKLHPRIPTLVRGFIDRTAAQSRPTSR